MSLKKITTQLLFRPLSPSLFALLIGPLAATVNQNSNTTGFQTSTTERKIVLYADNVLLLLQDPYKSLQQFFAIIKSSSELSATQ